MSAVVIIPTTGDAKVIQAIESVLGQSVSTKALVVVDGPEFSGAWAKTEMALLEKNHRGAYQVLQLPENTGRNGFYGHRIYAAVPHLVEEDHVFFLDQDNWFEPDHVESLIAQMSGAAHAAFAYALRNIIDKDGKFLCQDNCESLGRWPAWNDENSFHVDTSAYGFRREFLVTVCGLWHGGYAQDRRFFNIITNNIPGLRYETSGRYTLNYRLDGNPGSAAPEFFLQGNKMNLERYRSQGALPWVKPVRKA